MRPVVAVGAKMAGTSSREAVTNAIEAEDWQLLLQDHAHDLAGVSFAGAVISYVMLTKLDLEGCDFSGAIIEGCSFAQSNLYGATFNDASISDTSFSGALLTNAEFQRTEVFGSDFSLAELTGARTNDANFEHCEFSRSRGVSQSFLDQAVGDSSVIIPQSLDYPEHWLLSGGERHELDLIDKLKSFRGDEVLPCKFDGKKVVLLQLAQRDTAEIKSTLLVLQKKLAYLVEEKILHNEAPRLYRALTDYYNSITQYAGEDRRRWPKQLFELDEIQIGLEGNFLHSELMSSRSDLAECAPDKLPIVDVIVQTHFLLAAELPRWKAFVAAATEARFSDESLVRRVEEHIEELKEATSNDKFDIKIAESFAILAKMLKKPKEIARLAAYGVVRSVEAILSSAFSFLREFLLETRKEVLKKAPATAAVGVVGLMIGAGTQSLFSFFPHLQSWLDGGMAVLRSLGIL